jgi:uncharacterized damage-inducible protein DinB
MDVEDFRTLYDYNSWANRRTLEACAPLTPEEFTRDLRSSFGSVRDTLAHNYGAQWIWLERWNGRIPTRFPSPSDFPDFESVRNGLHELDRKLVDYVASLTPDDVPRVVHYKTTGGTTQAEPLWQMLQHLANHSTYHRGQITTLLRQLGARAVSTDLIAFYRERTAQARV